MNKKCFLGAILILILGVMNGCKEDIDLKNIDSHAEAELGFAIPMGSISANLGDFLGNGQVDGIYVDENRVLYFRDTFDIQDHEC